MLPELFPNIERRNEQLAKSIMFEVVDLPRNTPGNELEYKVSRGVMCIYSTTICIVCSVCLYCVYSSLDDEVDSIGYFIPIAVYYYCCCIYSTTVCIHSIWCMCMLI